MSPTAAPTATENRTAVVNLKVADSLDAWAGAERAGGRAPGTIRLRRYYLLRWAATIPAGDPVTAEQIRSWLAWPHWSPGTRRSAVSAIRSWLRWARRAGWPGPPAEDLELPQSRPGVPRPAPEAVIAAALASAGDADQLAILLGAECGLRRAEIAAAATTDLIGRRLVVRGKGRRERIVPVPEHLAQLIEARAPGPLFPGKVDGHMSPDAIGRRIRRALGSATAHQLRHRFATRAYQRTGDIVTLQRVLGHSSLTTTQVYTGPADDALDRLAAAVTL